MAIDPLKIGFIFMVYLFQDLSVSSMWLSEVRPLPPAFSQKTLTKVNLAQSTEEAEKRSMKML